MPWRVMVSIVWSIIPDLSIALTGAIVGKSLISSGDKLKGTGKATGNKPRKPKQVSTKVTRKPIGDQELLAYLQANVGASQQQVADHFGVTRQAIGLRLKKLYAVKS